MTTNRADVRKQFAERLSVRLTYATVYDYQVSDFNGASPVVIVTNAGTLRSDQVSSVESTMTLEVHTFVLYSVPPVQSTGVVGTIISLVDTSMFIVGQTVIVEDVYNSESATIVFIDPNVSITVDSLDNSYTLPKVYVWTESQSEDLIDELEHDITDEVRISNDDDIWLSIATQEVSVIDVVEIGGDPFRHETIMVAAKVEDF